MQGRITPCNSLIIGGEKLLFINYNSFIANTHRVRSN